MILTNYNGQNVYLLDLAPDWEVPVSVEFSLLADTQTGLTNRETRRPHSGTLRLSTRFGITADGVDARRVEAALRALTTEPVLVPLWPANVAWADRVGRAIGGGLNLAFKEDFSQWEIYEGVEPGWPAATDFCVPLIWGRLEKKFLNWINPQAFLWEMEHTEASPAAYAIAPAAVAFAAGPAPSVAWAVAPKVFPLEINFNSLNQDFAVAVIRDEIGFGRVPAETLYPQDVVREHQSGHLLATAAEAGKLLQFFLEHGGGKAFWVPDWKSAVVLTEGIGAGYVVLQVEDTVAVNVGDFIALLKTADGLVAATARITAKTADTITVDAAPGVFAADSTLVSALLLARFNKQQLRIEWVSGDISSASLPLVELPAEYTPAADETLGVTLGLLPTRCYLYEFARALNGVTYTDRFTSYENALTFGGNAYAAVKIEHGEISQGLFLDSDGVDIRTEVAAGTPLNLVAALRSESRVYLTIRQAEVNGANAVNASVVFTGEVPSAGPKGSRIDAKALTGGTIFDQPVPGFLFQQVCNHLLFSVGCTLVQADWKFTAAVRDPGVVGYPFEFVLETLAGSGASAVAALGAGGVGANFFALGWIEMGAGLNWQRRAVLLSTAPAAGVLTVTLDRDPNPYPVIGAAVVLYPGCDLQAATCKAKFNNYLNFGGHPLMPFANPSLVQRNRTGAGGKK